MAADELMRITGVKSSLRSAYSIGTQSPKSPGSVKKNVPEQPDRFAPSQTSPSPQKESFQHFPGTGRAKQTVLYGSLSGIRQNAPSGQSSSDTQHGPLIGLHVPGIGWQSSPQSQGRESVQSWSTGQWLGR